MTNNSNAPVPDIEKLWKALDLESSGYEYKYDQPRNTTKIDEKAEEGDLDTYAIKKVSTQQVVGTVVIRKQNDNDKEGINEKLLAIGLGSNPRTDSNPDHSKVTKLEGTRLNTLLSVKELINPNKDAMKLKNNDYRYAKYLLQFDISTLASNNDSDFKKNHKLSKPDSELIENLQLAFETFKFFIQRAEKATQEQKFQDYKIILGYGRMGKELMDVPINGHKNGKQYLELLSRSPFNKHLFKPEEKYYPRHISNANFKRIDRVEQGRLHDYFLS